MLYVEDIVSTLKQVRTEMNKANRSRMSDPNYDEFKDSMLEALKGLQTVVEQLAYARYNIEDTDIEV